MDALCAEFGEELAEPIQLQLEGKADGEFAENMGR